MLRVGVSGVAGKMGREIVAAMRDYKEIKLTAALESPDSPHLGEELSGVPISASFVAGAADVFIDFSVPAAATNLAAQCCAAKTPLVIGATGFAENEKAALSAAAADIALVVSPNMSVGVNVMFLLAEFAARRLRDCDAEISESHHRGKKDAPSGTALRLGEAVAAATGVNFADNAVFSRHGRDNIRRRGQIGFSVVRGGDIIGEHRLLFAGEGEQLEIVHRSSGRANYAHGAIAAARFAAAAPPGLYDMRDVLASRDFA